MAEPYQPINVSTGSAQQAIQSTPNVTPNLENLMQGIANGFISVDDIRKRASNGPLEAATRTQELADVQQIRPLRREAATAQLENIKAREQFEAESLPILNDTKREQLKQDYHNVLQHGVPNAVMQVFNKVVPGFIEYDTDKLFPKQGGINTAYALETMGKAFEKIEKIRKISGVKPTTIKDISATGEERTFEQLIDPVTGAPMGAKIPTGVKEVNQVEVDTKQKAAEASLSNDFLAERNRSDLLKRYGPQLGAFEIIDEIRNRPTPPKNSDDLAILYEFIKILDPTSVVREGEKKFAESTAPGMQQLYNRVQGLWSDSNRTIDSDTRQNLYATIDTIRGGAEKTITPEIKRLSNLAIDRGVPLEQALTAPELKLLVNGSGAAAPAAAGTPGAVTAAPAVAPAAGAVANIPNVQTVEQARALPPTVEFFRIPSGQLKRNPNFRP